MAGDRAAMWGLQAASWLDRSDGRQRSAAYGSTAAASGRLPPVRHRLSGALPHSSDSSLLGECAPRVAPVMGCATGCYAWAAAAHGPAVRRRWCLTLAWVAALAIVAWRTPATRRAATAMMGQGPDAPAYQVAGADVLTGCIDANLR
jgi:hypothetical protein